MDNKPNKDTKGKDKLEMMKVITMFNQVAITLITTMAFSLFIGYWIDRWLSTTPIFIMIFLLIGVIAAIRNMIVMLTKGMKPKTKEEWLGIYEEQKKQAIENEELHEEDEEDL